MIISDSKAPTRIAIAFAVSALAATAVTTPASAEAITIKQWVLKTEGYPAFLKFASEEFKKTHPDVDIVVEDFPNEAYKTTIQVALVGSDPPDVFFNWSGEDAHRLVRDGLALDITDLGKEAGGFESELSQGLAFGLRVRRQAITVCRPTPCRSISITTRRSSRITT